MHFGFLIDNFIIKDNPNFAVIKKEDNPNLQFF